MYLKERVVENKLFGHPSQGLYRMVLNGQAARDAKPGQFVHIQVSDTQDPLLRRPLSIAGIDPEKEEITIYYRVAGKGTDLLTRIGNHEYVSVLGPLGTGFTVPQDGEIVLIAGGIGIFPMYALLQAIDRTKVKVKLLWGGEKEEFLKSADLNLLQTMGIDYEVATLDGSLGTKGLVTALLEKYLVKKKGPAVRAASCGPKGMLKAVTEMCLQNELPIEVSLEERMACGIGACLGCVCTVKGENGEPKRKRVCKEGPVLDGKEVIWDAEF